MPDHTEITKKLEEHIRKDEKFQETTQQFEGVMLTFQAETEGSLALLHTKLEAIATKEDIGEIVGDVFTKLLVSKGKTAFTIIVGLGILTTSILAIFGGFKTLLGLLGFGLIHKP